MNKKQFLKRKSFRFRRFERKSYSAYNSMHKAVTIGVVSIMTLTFANTKTVNAQVISSSEGYTSEKTLDEFTLVEDALPNQMGKVVTVITSQEIEDLHVQSVAELLETISSVDIQTRGAHGIQTDVSLRGGNFDQTAILLDGINISNPHTGHYSMDIPISMQDIERIEIIKGPSAIIYGASAFSGGINIITKKKQNNNISLCAEVGEHGFASVESSGTLNVGNVENSLSVGYKTSNGYIENSAYDVFNILYRNNIYLKNNTLSMNIGYNFKDYDANTFYSAKFPNQHDKTSSLLASIKGLFNLGSDFQFLPSAYYNLHTDEFELIKNSGSANYHKSNVAGSNLTFKYYYKNFSLNFGTDIRFEEILSSVLGEETIENYSGLYNHQNARINFSFFVQGNYSLERFMATCGLLSFQNTAIKQNLSNIYPSVNLSYRFNKQWNVFASFNTASRLPSFTELYYKDAVHEANPNLKQEKSISYETGITYKNKFINASLLVFYTEGKNMIDWMKNCADDTQWLCKNINELNKYGIDVSASILFAELLENLSKNIRFNLSYSWMNAEKNNNNYISQYAFNYLRHKFNLQLALPIIKQLTLNLSGQYCVREGSFIEYQHNTAGEEKNYKPFFTMDANLQYEFKNKFTFFIAASNLFDVDYYDIGNIPQPNRWITAGIKFQL